MTDSKHTSIMRRMAGSRGQSTDAPLTVDRSVRLAAVKAFDRTFGLAVTVSGVDEDAVSLDGLCEVLADDLLLVSLNHVGGPVGLIALDAQLRAAVIEMQTIGKLLPKAPQGRPATATDRELAIPMVETFLKQIGAGTQVGDLCCDLTPGALLAGCHATRLALADHGYQLTKVGIDLGFEDRQGVLVLALPVAKKTDKIADECAGDASWVDQLRAEVFEGATTLEAVLHRFEIPLSQANAIKVGQVLPLYGCGVGSVSMIAADGRPLAQARLGQVGGMRAIRLEVPPMAELGKLPGQSSIDGLRDVPAVTAPSQMSAVGEG